MAISLPVEDVVQDYIGGRTKILVKDAVNLGVYATNGVTLTPDMVGVAQFFDIKIQPTTKANILLYSFVYDYSTQKVVGFTNADGAEISNATNLAGVPLILSIKGV